MADPLETFEDRAYRALIAREHQYERRVTAALRKALDDVRVSMSKVYERYAIDGELTRAEMTRYNRLATLDREITSTVGKAVAATARTIRRLAPDQYEASFFRYAWAMDNASGLRIAYGVLNRDVVLENTANTFQHIAIENYGNVTRNQIRSALNSGLAQGKSYQRMIGDLKKVMNAKNFEALRILRTEGQSAINAGQDDAYTRAEARGVEGEHRWDSTLDDRTRLTHQSMDGKIRQPDGLFNGPGGERAPYPAWEGLTAGERIQCRCRLRFQIAGYEPQLRRTREQGVIPYQTYEQWKSGAPLEPKVPLAIVPKKFTSVSEAKTYIQDTLGIKSVKLKNTGLDVLDEYRRGADSFVDAFPQIKGHVNKFTENTASTQYGKYRIIPEKGKPLTTELKFSGTMGSSMDKLKEQIARDVKMKFHFDEMTPAHIMAHELTHVLQDKIVVKALNLNRAKEMTNAEYVLFASSWNSGKYARQITDAALGNMGLAAVPKTAAEARAAYDAVKGLGSYALQSKNELMAEAISDALLSKNPQAFSLEVLKEARKIARTL